MRSASATGALQLQDLGQGLARLGVELLGLGEDPDLLDIAVEQSQLLVLRLLLDDLGDLGLVAARQLERQAIIAFADLDSLGVRLGQVQPGRRRCRTISWRGSLAGPCIR